MATHLKDLLKQHTMPGAPELVRPEGNHTLRCLACAHRCKIADGKSGNCRVRFNRGGELRVPAGYVAGLQVDPIEKKPFYHVYPGSDALSFGMLGCNFHCPFCQNWISSQTLRDDDSIATPSIASAHQIIDVAIQRGTPLCVSTYNEPLITADWSVEIFKLARENGIRCGYVSNGHATPEVLEYLRPYMDLFKVDLKCHDERSYRMLGGSLQAVLDTITRLKVMDFWVEVVTLVVPGFNDNNDELSRIATFLAGVSDEIPWHVTAFHPDYKMTDQPRTSPETLLCAYDIGKSAGLKFVYAGNMPGSVGSREDTYCPDCGELLIRRFGFYVKENRMKGNQCPKCGSEIPGVWNI